MSLAVAGLPRRMRLRMSLAQDDSKNFHLVCGAIHAPGYSQLNLCLNCRIPIIASSMRLGNKRGASGAAP